MSREPLLSWRSWPFVERPVHSLFLISFLLLLSVLLFRLTIISWNMPLFYFGGMILVIGNLLPYFIQTEYMMYETEIVVYYAFIKISRPYSQFGCFYKDKYGVMLSPFKLPRRLDPFRGQSLRFSKTREEESALMELLRAKIGKEY
ncbi:MAG: hypothetical protein PHO35_06080 [Candidatus Cloacimonetes bacterium]|nr:hypothetical protein [Candidatus Cloacimonadota bacterium]